MLYEVITNLYARKMNRPIRRIPPAVMEAMARYDWPGNVRELQNLVQRAVILSPGDELVSPFSALREPEPMVERGLDERLVDVERSHILQVLKESGGVLGGENGAAARLGIPRTTLIYKMRRLSIPRSFGGGS